MRKFSDRRRACLKLIAGAGVSLGLARLGSAAETEALLRKPIPASGELLPVIGLGTSRVFDVGASPEERAGPREVMRALAAVEHSLVDSSPMYGRAEAVVGEIGADLGVRGRLFYATKVWTEGRDAGIGQMRRSMELMQADPLDLIQIHNLVDWRTHLRTLREWKEQGRVRYIGITHYHEDAHPEVESVLRAEPLDFLQINYSLAEPEAAERLLPLARERGVAVIANRPFARGRLFRAVRDRELPAWAAEFDCGSWAQFFLKFVVSHPAVTLAIPGTSKLRHMLDNQQAGRGRMPDRQQREAMLANLREML